MSLATYNKEYRMTKDPMIKVLIEQTNVEMCVPQSYYDKYSGTGIRHLGAADAPKVSTGPTYKELKEACKEAGIEFPGNASKAKLTVLLEDHKEAEQEVNTEYTEE